MRRRAFLTILGGGGLAFYGMQAKARGQDHHSAAPTRKPSHSGHASSPHAASRDVTEAPPLNAISENTRQQITQLITIAPYSSRRERILRISQNMKGTPYLAQPLIGSTTTPEELILSWRGVNCMTFVEIVLAASASHTVEGFIHALITTRYRQHHVAFAERRHFLSDWLHGSPALCRDITPHFPYAESVQKTLNLKGPLPHTGTGKAAANNGKSQSLSRSDAPLPPPVSSYHHDGVSQTARAPLISPEQQQTIPPSPASSTLRQSDGTRASVTTSDRYLPGLPLTKRRVSYLPTYQFLADLRKGRSSHARKLIQSGDIIGIYSPLPGLDVFHIGIALWHGEELLFRNASSLPAHRYVVDTPLAAYLKERRGVVVYRVK